MEPDTTFNEDPKIKILQQLPFNNNQEIDEFFMVEGNSELLYETIKNYFNSAETVTKGMRRLLTKEYFLNHVWGRDNLLKRTPINKTLKQWLQARFVTPLEIEDPLGEKTKQIISRIQHVFHDTRMNEKKMKRKRQVLESYNFVDTKPSISEDSFNMFDDK